MAVASVTTNIVIKGQDDASAAINKASKSAQGLTGALQQTQSKAQGLTGSLRSMVSGDVMGGLKGLSGGLGSGGGLAGSAALAAAGIAGVAVAIGAAAVKATEWSIELERLRARMNFAFAGGADEAFALAKAIGGVGVESVVKLSTTLKAAGVDGKITVEQMQAITNAATAMGKTGDEALSAFADAIRTGSGRALKQVGVFVSSEKAIKDYADGLGIATSGLTDAQRSQAILNATLAAVPGLAQAGTDAHSQQDRALSDLSNAWEKLKLQLSELLAGPALSIVKSLTEMVEGFQNLERVGKVALEALKSPLKGLQSGFERAARAALLLKRGDFAEAAIAGGEALAKIATLGTAQALDEAGSAFYRVDERASRAATSLETTGGAASGLADTLNALARAERVVAERTKVAGAAAEKAASKRRDAARAAQQEAKALADLLKQQDDEFVDDVNKGREADRAKKIKDRADEIKFWADRANAVAAFQDQVMAAEQSITLDPAESAVIQQKRIQIDLQRQLAQINEEYEMDEVMRQNAIAAATINANARMLESTRQLAQYRTEQAFGVAEAVVQGLGMIEGAERAQAGVQALIETARSIQSFAMYDFAAGIQHGIAAAAFAKAALTPTPAAPSGSAGAQRPIQQPTQTGGSTGGSVVININGGGIVGTAAEVGAALAKTMKAATGTGKAAFA